MRAATEPPRAAAGSREPGPSGGDRPSLLIVTSTFPLHRGDGIPRFVQDLAEALAAHARVRVLAPSAPGIPGRERWGAVDISRHVYFWPRALQRLAYGGGMPHNLRSSWLARWQVLPFLWSQGRAVRRMVDRHSIDWVNAHWLVPQGLATAWARGRRRRFRLLLQVHSTDVHLLRRLPLGRRIARYVVRRCDGLLVTSSYVRDALDELLGFASGAEIQPMGVRVEIFRRQGRPSESPEEASLDAGGSSPYLLFVGRLVEVKGVVYLLRAMPRVRQRHPDLELVVAGSGPREGALRREAERLGLAGSVRFLGTRSHPEIVRLLHGCRAAVVPSIVTSRGETEGMPTVVLEALAAGARVVASAVGGVPDVVRHGENGWLCRARDPEDLARAILIAIEEPAGAVERAARATAAGYDWTRVASRYLDRLREPASPRAGAETGLGEAR